jgi:hypothetical protein
MVVIPDLVAAKDTKITISTSETTEDKKNDISRCYEVFKFCFGRLTTKKYKYIFMSLFSLLHC